MSWPTASTPADAYWRITLRAFAQVSAVAWNVSNIAAGQYGLALVSGAAVSWIWWANSRTAARYDGLAPRVCYTLGAALGTVFGMWLGRAGML